LLQAWVNRSNPAIASVLIVVFIDSTFKLLINVFEF